MPLDADHAFADAPVYGRPRFLPAPLARTAILAGEARRRLRAAAAWAVFERRATVAAGCRLGPSAWCVNAGSRERVRLGRGTVCRGVLRREHFGDGLLVVGDDVYIGDDCLISCCHSVEIGDGTLLAHGVQILDNDSHPLDAEARARDWAIVRGARLPEEGRTVEHAPVAVGRRAWIGAGAIVLKGVTVGEGAVVAAGSVVTSDVEPFTVVAGNPARPTGRRAAARAG